MCLVVIGFLLIISIPSSILLNIIININLNLLSKDNNGVVNEFNYEYNIPYVIPLDAFENKESTNNNLTYKKKYTTN